MDWELKSRIDALSSCRAGTKTSSQPASSPGRARGNVTRLKVRSHPVPVTRALFQRGIDLAKDAIGRAHAERDVTAGVGEQDDQERAVDGHGQPKPKRRAESAR